MSAVPVLSLLLLAGCASGEAGAMVACETLINQRVGVELTHNGPLEGATAEGQGPYVVTSAFTEPATARITNYVCTVERIDDGWRLVDLVTDR